MVRWFAWGTLALLGLVLLARFCQLLVGPMLRYQLVQMSRRSRLYLVRFGYGALLLGLLLAANFNRSTRQQRESSLDDVTVNLGIFGRPDLQSDLSTRYLENAHFATNFFAVYTVVQYVLLLVLTPAFMAGVLTEQKEHKTFHILFTTDLSSLEMVFGLFVSRLFLLGMVFLAGLPAIPLLEFIGSVDPSMVWSCTAALLITIVSVGSLSALNSVLCKDSMDAILGTYTLLAIYLVLSALARLLLLPNLSLADFPSTQTWHSPVTLADIVRWLNAGNMATAAYDLLLPLRYSQDIGVEIRQRLFSYAVFNIVVAFFCCSLTVLLLRRQALAEPMAGERQGHTSGLRKLVLDAWPLFWLECHLGSPRLRRWTSRFVAGCGVALLFVVPVHLLYFFGRFSPAESSIRLADLLNLWARPVVAFLGTLLIILSGIRASRAIVRDRAALTNDGLLLLPISNASILGSKWLASMLGGRRIWAVLIILASYGLVAGFIHPLGICFFLAIWFASCLFMTSLGLWMSIECPSARVATVLTVVIAGAAMLAVVFNPDWLTSFGWSELERRAFVSPTAFFDLLLSFDQFRYWPQHPRYLQVHTLLTGLLFWVLVSCLVFGICLVRYRRKTGRKSGMSSTANAPDGATSRFEWRMLGSAALRMGRLFGQDLRRSLGRAVVLFLPLGVLCATYFVLGWRNASDLRSAVHDLDEQAPGWQTPSDGLALGGQQPFTLDPYAIPELRQADQTFVRAEEGAYQLAAEGKNDEALQSCDAMLEKVDGLEGGSAFARFGKRQSLQSRAYYCMGAILVGGIARESTLTRLIDRIEAEDRFPYVATSLRAARQEFDVRMTYLQRGHTPQESELNAPKRPPVRDPRDPRWNPFLDNPSLKASRSFDLPAGLPAVPDLKELDFLIGQALPRQHALGLEAATSAIDTWSLSLEQRKAEAEQAGDQTNFSAFDTAGFESSVRTWELIAIERHAVLATLLIERFRLRHSAWPEQTDQVARELGRAFPLDPCGKGSIQYRKKPDGVVAYSIGFDSIDNGGALYKGHGFPPGGFDIGFFLPNPNQRKFLKPVVEEETPRRRGDMIRFP